jgi:hypothetical protein
MLRSTLQRSKYKNVHLQGNLYGVRSADCTAHVLYTRFTKFVLYRLLTWYNFTILPKLPRNCLTDCHQHRYETKDNRRTMNSLTSGVWYRLTELLLRGELNIHQIMRKALWRPEERSQDNGTFLLETEQPPQERDEWYLDANEHMQCLNACHEFLRLVLPYPESSAVVIPTRMQKLPGLNLARTILKSGHDSMRHILWQYLERLALFLHSSKCIVITFLPQVTCAVGRDVTDKTQKPSGLIYW